MFTNPIWTRYARSLEEQGGQLLVNMSNHYRTRNTHGMFRLANQTSPAGIASGPAGSSSEQRRVFAGPRTGREVMLPPFQIVSATVVAKPWRKKHSASEDLASNVRSPALSVVREDEANRVAREVAALPRRDRLITLSVVLHSMIAVIAILHNIQPGGDAVYAIGRRVATVIAHVLYALLIQAVVV